MKIDNPQQYIGKRYGSLTILKYYGKYRDGRLDFICKCDCGNEFRAIMREKDKIKKSCDACRCKYHFYYNGENLSLSQISERFNITLPTLEYRILHKKMTLEEALNYDKLEPKDKKEWRTKNRDKLREKYNKWLDKNKDYHKKYRLLKIEEIRQKDREIKKGEPNET